MPYATRYSKHYFWCTNDVVGKGTTSVVYKGVHRSTGEIVAVKTLTYVGGITEFEVLKKVNHENIVKLLAIEEEETATLPSSKSKPLVIVTEFGTGGCLDSILSQPENVYGLPDSEFLLVLKHLYQAMKYLRENDIIHRDLKPANIMKCINDDGSTIYKLIDFGCARELSDEGVFKSLCGTEEYLAPDMYKKAFLEPHDQESMTFQATVDLWSIGVTLYHVATGNLPFVPYGGRRNDNKNIMHYITSKKASGVISGIQKELNGPIYWSSKLPAESLLSPGLKRMITPLLAGLMESDNNKIWSFEKFFKETEQILSTKLVHVFYLNFPRLMKLYLPQDGGLERLSKELLYEGVTQNTELFCNSAALENDFFPLTNEECPLFIICKDDIKIFVPNIEISCDVLSFTIPVKTDHDLRQAKKACSHAFQIKREIEKLTLCGKLMKDLAQHYARFIKKSFKNLQQQNNLLISRFRRLKKTAKILEVSQKTNAYKYNALIGENLIKIFKEFAEVSKSVNLIYRKYQESLWEKLPEVRQSAKTQATSLTTILLSIKENLGRKDFPRPDSNVYLLERRKFRTTQKNLFRIQSEVSAQFKDLCCKFEEDYKLVYVDLLKVAILKSNMSNTENKLDMLEKELDGEYENYSQYLETRFTEKPVLSNKVAEMLQWKQIEDIIKKNQTLCNELLSSSLNFSSFLENLPT